MKVAPLFVKTPYIPPFDEGGEMPDKENKICIFSIYNRFG